MKCFDNTDPFRDSKFNLSGLALSKVRYDIRNLLLKNYTGFFDEVDLLNLGDVHIINLRRYYNKNYLKQLTAVPWRYNFFHSNILVILQHGKDFIDEKLPPINVNSTREQAFFSPHIFKGVFNYLQNAGVSLNKLQNNLKLDSLVVREISDKVILRYNLFTNILDDFLHKDIAYICMSYCCDGMFFTKPKDFVSKKALHADILQQQVTPAPVLDQKEAPVTLSSDSATVRTPVTDSASDNQEKVIQFLLTMYMLGIVASKDVKDSGLAVPDLVTPVHLDLSLIALNADRAPADQNIEEAAEKKEVLTQSPVSLGINSDLVLNLDRSNKKEAAEPMNSYKYLAISLLIIGIVLTSDIVGHLAVGTFICNLLAISIASYAAVAGIATIGIVMSLAIASLCLHKYKYDKYNTSESLMDSLSAGHTQKSELVADKLVTPFNEYSWVNAARSLFGCC